MATPFFMGLGVAGCAIAARTALLTAESLKANPEVMRQMGAAAAGFRGMGNAFKMPKVLSQMMGRSTGDLFEATMTRREASQVLGIRCAHAVSPVRFLLCLPCVPAGAECAAWVSAVRGVQNSRSRKRTARL